MGALLQGNDITFQDNTITHPVYRGDDTDGLRFFGDGIKIVHNTISDVSDGSDCNEDVCGDGPHPDCMQSEQEVALRHRQPSAGAGSTTSPSIAHGERVGVDLGSSGSASFSGMSALPTPRVSRDRAPAAAARPSRSASPSSSAARRDERAPSVAAAARRRAPNIGRGSTGCGVGIEALASPICAQAIIAALEHHVRPDAEERRVPQHEVGQLADLDRADLAVEAVRDRRADRVLGDVAPGPLVVGARRRRAARRGAASSRARSARCG